MPEKRPPLTPTQRMRRYRESIRARVIAGFAAPEAADDVALGHMIVRTITHIKQSRGTERVAYRRLLAQYCDILAARHREASSMTGV